MPTERLPATRAAIAALIPHQGNMCLLEAVADCSATRIVCTTASHRAPDNPLRRDGRLAAVHLCEYGAQAMALHGALISQANPNRPGWLVALREVELEVAVVDCETALTVSAQCIQAGAAGLQYGFAVHSGTRRLATGRATVSFGRAS